MLGGWSVAEDICSVVAAVWLASGAEGAVETGDCGTVCAAVRGEGDAVE